MSGNPARATLMIDTSRLRLRPHRLEDFERYLPLWTQPEPPDTASPLILTAEEVWDRLLRWVGHWSHFGFGLFLALDRESDTIVGEVGLGYFHRGIGAHFDGMPEAAWRVLATRRGEGLASEAMQGVLGWFDRAVRTPRTVCLIYSANTRSIRVAERLGYREFGNGWYRERPALLFERTIAP